VPGANVVTLISRDPLTGRDSDPIRRTITVVTASPVPTTRPTPQPTATPAPS